MHGVVKSSKMQFSQLSLDGPPIRVEIQGCRTVTRDPQATSFILNYHRVPFQVFKTRY